MSISSNHTAVGPELTGHVLIVTPHLGVAYVQEDVTNRRFGLSRNFCDSSLFDQLIGDTTVDAQGHPVSGQGSRIKFRETGHNVIASFEILSP